MSNWNKNGEKENAEFCKTYASLWFALRNTAVLCASAWGERLMAHRDTEPHRRTAHDACLRLPNMVTFGQQTSHIQTQTWRPTEPGFASCRLAISLRLPNHLQSSYTMPTACHLQFDNIELFYYFPFSVARQQQSTATFTLSSMALLCKQWDQNLDIQVHHFAFFSFRSCVFDMATWL